MMFGTRAAPARPQAPTPGSGRGTVPRPQPASHQAAPRPQPASHPAPPRPQPAPAPAPAGGDDEILPSWDDAAVNALLSSSEKAIAAPQAPTHSMGPVSSPRMAAGSGTTVCRLDIGGATSVGRVRQRNEDSFLIHHLGWSNRNQYRELALTIVADGLGGHQGGDMASGLAINMIGNGLAPMLTGTMTGQVRDTQTFHLTQAIDSAIKGANMAIYRRSQGDANLRGMASTVAVVVVWDGQVVIGHIGDCRVYHYRQGSMTQVTKDQTLVARLVDLGHITPAQALTHPSRNEVAQAVGLRNDIDPASYQTRLAAGEWLIVACDGLHAHVDLKTLEQIVKLSIPGASYVANNLVDLANQGGGTDNCTVVAIRGY
jgi:serine/threonine protein phosphatase PrpC